MSKMIEDNDSVYHPSHYCQGGLELLDFITAWQLDFLRGNVVKYICRAKLKGNEVEDLKKARFYLDRDIEIMEGKKNA